MAKIENTEIKKQVVQQKSATASKPKADDTKSKALFGKLTTSAKTPSTSTGATTAEDAKVKNNISAFGNLTTSPKTSTNSADKTSIFANRLNSAQKNEETKVSAFSPAFGISANDTTTEGKELTAKELSDKEIEEMQKNKLEHGTASFGMSEPQEEKVEQTEVEAIQAAMAQEGGVQSEGKVLDSFKAFDDTPNAEYKGGHGGHGGVNGNGGHGGIYSKGNNVINAVRRMNTGHANSAFYRQVHNDWRDTMGLRLGIGSGMMDRVTGGVNYTRGYNQALGDMAYGGCGGSSSCGGGKTKWWEPLVYGLSNGLGAGLGIGLPIMMWEAFRGDNNGGQVIVPTSGGTVQYSGGSGNSKGSGVANGIGSASGNIGNIIQQASINRTDSSTKMTETHTVSTETANNMNNATGKIDPSIDKVTAQMVNDGNAALKNGSAQLNKDSATLAAAEGRKEGYSKSLEENKKYVAQCEEQEKGVEAKTKELENAATNAEKDLNKAQGEYDKAVEKQSVAAKNLEDTGLKRDKAVQNVEKYQTSVKTAETNVTNAETALSKAQAQTPKDETAVSQAKTALENAKQALESEKKNLETAKTELEKLQKEYTEAQKAKDEADKALTTCDDEKVNAKEALDAARKKHDKAVFDLEKHKAQVDEAKNWFTESDDKLKEATANVEQIQPIVQQAKDAHQALETKVIDANNALEQKFKNGNKAVEGYLGKPVMDNDGSVSYPNGSAGQTINSANNVLNRLSKSASAIASPSGGEKQSVDQDSDVTGDGTPQNANADTSGESEYSSDSMLSHIPPKNNQGVDTGSVNGSTTDTSTLTASESLENFHHYDDPKTQYEKMSAEEKSAIWAAAQDDPNLSSKLGRYDITSDMQ